MKQKYLTSLTLMVALGASAVVAELYRALVSNTEPTSSIFGITAKLIKPISIIWADKNIYTNVVTRQIDRFKYSIFMIHKNFSLIIK